MRFSFILCLLHCLYIVTKQQELDIPSIDDSVAGNLGFVGNYAGISKVRSTLQFETLLDQPSSLIHIVQNGSVFEKRAVFDGNITSSCVFENDIYLGGYFRTINQSIPSRHIVKYNTQTDQFQPLLEGLDGPVYSLYCDQVDKILYVGGNFSLPLLPPSTAAAAAEAAVRNVAQWSLSNHSWLPLPWVGFNGPVYTITKNTKYNTILFGGQFDQIGDGRFFNSNESQIVSLSSPTTISSGNGIGNPENIVCPFKQSPEEEGEPWYLQDGVPGYWDANFVNPIQPTVFRLSNTHSDSGTVSFNILALGSNEYFDLSYQDPVTHQTIQCSDDCILSNATFQDFTVLSKKPATGIRVNVNSWYGSRGGLGYVQIFQSDISVNPHLQTSPSSQCNPTTSSTQTLISGDWEDVYVYGYYQTILQTNTLFSNLSNAHIGITYQLNIPAQGQYDIYATTPGCVGSANCFERTQVEYELTLSPTLTPVNVVLDQNTFSDRKVLLYSGLVSPATDTFRPVITLKPAANAASPINGGDHVTIMADSIELVRQTTTGPLVNILEYNPALENATRSWKPLNQQLALGSSVHTIDATQGDVLYIGGHFSEPEFTNIVSYDRVQGKFVPLAISQLNGQVTAVTSQGNILYVAGEFNASGTNTNASHIIEYDTIQKTWTPLDHGVDGAVRQLRIQSDVLYISGDFQHHHVSSTWDGPLSIGNAMWNTSSKQWIERDALIVGAIAFEDTRYMVGSMLGAQTFRTPLVTSDHFTSDHAFHTSMVLTAGVTWMNNLTLPAQPVTIVAGYPYESHPTTMATTIFMYTENNTTLSIIDHVRGTVNVLAVLQNKLFVGGQFVHLKSKMASLLMYDLTEHHPTLLSISGVYSGKSTPGTVHTIKSHPDGKRVVVGGQFTRVGLFECNGICVIDPVIRQWNQIAVGFPAATVSDIAVYADHDEKQKMVAVSDKGMASLEGQTWEFIDLNQVPGIPAMALHSGGNEFIISGKSADDKVFMGSYSNGKYTAIDTDFGQGTNISQILFVPVSSSSSIEQRFPSGTQNMLLAVGDLNLLQLGRYSAALYDGMQWYPYLVTTQANGKPGMIYQVVHTTNYDGLRAARKYLSVAVVVLISIGISTGILFAMSALGLLFMYKKHQKVQGAEDLPGWKSNRRHPFFLESLGVFGTGTLGASTIAATAPRKASDSALFTHPRPIMQQKDDLNIAVSPTTTIIHPLPVQAASAPYTTLGGVAAQPPPSDTSLKIVYAKYPFKAQEFGELSFEIGDAIVVTDTTTDAIWWLGYKNDGTDNPMSGVFPSNYVQE